MVGRKSKPKLIICSNILVLSSHESALSTQYLTLTSSIYLPKASRSDGRKSLDNTTAFVPEFVGLFSGCTSTVT